MNLRKRWWVALGAAVISALLASAVVLAKLPVAGMQLSLYDTFFVADNGPRWGSHPFDGRIVLVELDEAAVSQRAHGVEDDLAVYRNLLASGVKRIADTRLLATEPERSALFAALPLLGAEPGQLTRESAFAAQDLRPEYVPFLGHHGLNLISFVGSTRKEHFVPLLLLSERGLVETTGVSLARAELGLEPATDVAPAMRESGILHAWQEWLPSGTRLRGPLGDAAPSEHRDYPLGPGHRVPWMEMPTGADLVPPAQLWVDYGLRASDFPVLRYSDVRAGKVDAAALKDKLVLIGFPPSLDGGPFVPAVSATRVSFATLLAYQVETLVHGWYLRPWPARASFALFAALALVGAALAASFRVVPALVAVVSALVGYFVLAVGMARHGRFPDLVLAPLCLATAAAIVFIYRLSTEERQRRRVTNLFGRYVARRVVDDILRRPDSEVLAVGGVKREITVLFADVRGFTTYSDKFPPEKVVTELNAILGLMVACAFDNEGTVDKYIGDAILVLFNAPQAQPDHALRAVRTAWAMQKALEGHPSGLAFGIGIHTGEAVVGTVGTPERLEYTAIGATVNLASRMCSSAGRGEVAISDAVEPLVSREFETLQRPPIHVKGIARELTTYLVSGPAEKKAGRP